MPSGGKASSGHLYTKVGAPHSRSLTEYSSELRLYCPYRALSKSLKLVISAVERSFQGPLLRGCLPKLGLGILLALFRTCGADLCKHAVVLRSATKYSVVLYRTGNYELRCSDQRTACNRMDLWASLETSTAISRDQRADPLGPRDFWLPILCLSPSELSFQASTFSISAAFTTPLGALQTSIAQLACPVS